MCVTMGPIWIDRSVRTQESMMQAARATRAGGHVGHVAVNHGATLPGVFDLELSLDQAAEGYQALDQRQAIKVLLRP
jgi:hypothetical protein